ncbi:monocarboxylate transporter 14-like [Haliotis rufescens]|uniref:monocarboxylate transporter 14-like n=1 Tax=Haliotis rufescens TaxID=6454 RepID=UPI00201E91FC|nr:monocarboxylate transporter 14-like [Haliotis rufescens]
MSCCEGGRRRCEGGWLVVLACFGVNTLMMGYIKCFGILFVEFIHEYNASASMTSLVMGLTSASTSIMSLVVLNILMGRLSIRKLALAGAILASLGVVLTSVSASIEFLLFSQSVLVGSSQGLLYGPGIVLIGEHFDQRRTIATATATSGISVGAMLMPLLLRYLLDNYNLRGALLILGGLMLEMVVFATFYRTAPVERESHDGTTCRLDERRINDEEQHTGNSEDTTNSEYVLKHQSQGLNDCLLHELESGDISEDDAPCDCQRQNTHTRTYKSVGGDRKIDDNFESIGNGVDANFNRYLASNIPCRCSTVKFSSHSDSICLSTFSLHGKATALSESSLNRESKCYHRNCDTALFSNPKFWIIFGFTFFGIIGTNMFPVLLPPLATEKGLSEMEVALFVSLFAGLDFISRVCSGIVAELPWVNRRYMLISMFIVLGIIYQFTSFYSNFRLMLLFVVLFGLINGVYATLHPPLIIDFLGYDYFSKVFGFVQVFHGAAMSTSFPLLGFLRDVTGTYTTAFYVLGATQFIGAVFLLVEPLSRRAG